MSKAKTLAGTVSTGGVLATPGSVPASAITGLATVATSGAYADLSGKPTLPAGDVVGTTDAQTLTNKTIDIANNTLTGVQPTLVSGTSIKTVNSTTLLGSGDVVVQPTLVSGTNIKTIGGQSVLGSGDVPLPSPAPEFVANGSIASAGLAVSLRSDGKVEVTTGTNPSASVGTPVSPDGAANSLNFFASVYDPVSGNVVVAYKDGSNGRAIVGVVSGSTITFGTATTFNSTLGDSITANYDTANNKVVLVFRNTSGFVRAIVGTVSGNSISFGSVANQNDALESVGSTYDSVSGKVVIVGSNPNVSDTGNIYLATVSGTSISISYAGSLGTNVNSPVIAADVADQKIVVFFRDTNNSSRGSTAVGTISGSSISFTGGRTVFDTNSSSNFAATYLPSIGATLIANNGKARVCKLSSGTPTFSPPVTFASSDSEFSSTVYNPGQNKIVIVYKDNGSSTGRYASGVATVSGITLDSAVTWLATNPQYLSAVYHPASDKVVASYQNGSSGNGFSVAIQVAGVVTNANTFIGFSQSSAADGATLKVATEANIDANQTGLTANAQYYVNFDGTLTTTATAYPLAGTALSATRIQVATSPEFAPLPPADSVVAWVNFSGFSPSIRASKNISSVTKDGAGFYIVNFASELPNANYVTLASCGESTNSPLNINAARSAPGTTFCVVETRLGDNRTDLTYIYVAIVR